MSVTYGTGEAREWALEHLHGNTGCLSPTFTSDLRSLNEPAIRHDMALEAEIEMSGVLIVSECGTTFEELKQLTEITVDAANGKLHTLAHAALPTLEDNLALVRHAAEAGVSGVLLSYPMTFYPVSDDEIFEYTRAVAEETHLGVVLFPHSLWNFRRLHPGDFNPDLIDRLVNEVPNIMAIKSELGLPAAAGTAQMFERYAETLVVTDPLEENGPLWQRAYGMRWMGSSNYEAMGNQVPTYFNLLNEDKFEEAMEVYWRIHPTRQVNQALNSEAMAGTAL